MIFLDCPYSEKDECKSLGAKWDPTQKKWYVPDGVDATKFKKWITSDNINELQIHNNLKTIINLSPSSLDFQFNKCKRCFYLSKKFGIQTDNYPPPVFNKLDIIQKNYFIEKNTQLLTKHLPEGKFLSEKELPAKISSSELKDDKGRSFKLVGIPDIVVKFSNNEYGIIDFKTTKLSDQKANFYKFQLEAYATIFENPGQINNMQTPLLKPITKLAIMQFDPERIDNSNEAECNMAFLMGYVELNDRITSELYDRVTQILDVLENDTIPPFNKDCNDCKFVLKQSGF